MLRPILSPPQVLVHMRKIIRLLLKLNRYYGTFNRWSWHVYFRLCNTISKSVARSPLFFCITIPYAYYITHTVLSPALLCPINIYYTLLIQVIHNRIYEPPRPSDWLNEHYHFYLNFIKKTSLLCSISGTAIESWRFQLAPHEFLCKCLHSTVTLHYITLPSCSCLIVSNIKKKTCCSMPGDQRTDGSVRLKLTKKRNRFRPKTE